jgi:hypothetical protein
MRVERTTMTASAAPAEAPSPPTELLPEPSSEALGGDDPGAALAKLVIDGATRDKRMMRALRAEAEAARRAAEKRQLEALRDKANAGFAAGVVSGGTMAASGALHVADSGDGTGKITEGLGSVGSACGRHAADSADAAATADGQEAAHCKTASDDARDAARDASDLAGKAIAFYKEYVTAREETKRAALIRA